MGDSPPQHDGEEVVIGELPEAIADGATVLIAGTIDPTEYALCLRTLCHYSDADDNALVVTTTEGARQTIDQYRQVCPQTDPPNLRLVDMASQQYISAVYEDIPTVSIPSPGDLERLMLALSDITAANSESVGRRHLVVRSLTPILDTTPVSRVTTVLERISGIRTATGLGIFGLDYTAHDEATMEELTSCVDGVIWVTKHPDGRLEFELRSTRAHHKQHNS